ncbi:beta-1,4-mannosyl-glycoprotein 4-beta-N-acetylglucosaminyltransferase-like [Lingula anatina]|uniref:Beta-1,4-mannosyl-glycoprotein 4-beta-N-acetylglucosaminyltransferase-like n=1 Tax=Lingula anatina TaxID=7574 RepID=A0A1S3I3I7_LINAN|nr:beta-1,4-mannosyl-glycoprotein 4-beta-N-acetylglucosaminyltransferase-like [Lingula anatina]|eukprot:XP_013392827.1 beta-1,4-mannosyl-glycoprotein 4-beta-N-acetylglucosaminyltransferase-like [Lingula anatina]
MFRSIIPRIRIRRRLLFILVMAFQLCFLLYVLFMNYKSNIKIGKNVGSSTGRLNEQKLMRTAKSSVATCKTKATRRFPDLYSIAPVQLDKTNVGDQYFVSYNGTRCFKFGTLRRKEKNGCVCQKGWTGNACSTPEVARVGISKLPQEIQRKIKIRKHPRKVVISMLLNHEFDTLEALVRELTGLVDVVMIEESNFTLHGDPKLPLFYQKLHSGYLCDFYSNIIYIYLDHFLEDGKTNGFKMEGYARNYISKGFPSIAELRPDDLFLHLDADEVPSRDAIAFLKFHDGYPEPFGFVLRWSVYGYFWKMNRVWTVQSAGCSVGMLRQVYDNQPGTVRGGIGHIQQGKIREYKKGGNDVLVWQLGEQGKFAGWHCSWCFDINGIKTKLLSALSGDGERFGDDPKKQKLDFLRTLVREGRWFDGDYLEPKGIKMASPATDKFFAPNFILSNKKRFKHLITNYLLDENKKDDK